MKGFIDNARDERQTELGPVMEECTMGCGVRRQGGRCYRTPGCHVIQRNEPHIFSQ